MMKDMECVIIQLCKQLQGVDAGGERRSCSQIHITWCTVYSQCTLYIGLLSLIIVMYYATQVLQLG